MTYQEILEKVTIIVAELLEFDVAEVSPNSAFVEDLYANSIDTVQLVLVLEEEFDIKISDEEGEKIATVKDAVDHIAEKIGTTD